ncbi:MAG: 3'-5' exonuclease [Clostridia bacterium]|nr:3'-5' exonuclease [Clostridia bacterium]
MKYLFFDIECAGVFKNVAKICAFGYCLTDERFRILEKEDILINPQGGFHLTDRKGTQGLVLPYKYEDFKNYPTFSDLADGIYKLLQDEDTLVCGHASMNDVKYLNLESKRFHLPSFCFAFADTQFLYMNKIGEFSRQFGLGAIAKELGVEFTPHRAVDDAYATMRVAQAMCEAEGLTLSALLEKYQITLGRIEDYEVAQTTSVAFESYRAEKDRAREKRDRQRAEFHIFADRAKRRRAKDGKLKNKSVCFSHSLELATELAERLLLAAFAQGARITYRAEECDIYLCFEGESGQRLQSATARGAKLLTPTAFEAYLEE